jgi:guanyl-specific ribonuclease Sa
MQLDSSVVVQDQNSSQQQGDLTAAAAAAAVPAAVPAGVQAEASKLEKAQMATAQQLQSEQQQLFTLLLSGVPLSYTDAELLPLLQQVRTCGFM